MLQVLQYFFVCFAAAVIVVARTYAVVVVAAASAYAVVVVAADSTYAVVAVAAASAYAVVVAAAAFAYAVTVVAAAAVVVASVGASATLAASDTTPVETTTDNPAPGTPPIDETDCGTGKPTSKILQGKNTSMCDWPYIAAIRVRSVSRSRSMSILKGQNTSMYDWPCTSPPSA